MSFHFPEQVETNVLTIDATDPKSGTAEFKAAAIKVEKIPVGEEAGRSDGEPAVAHGNGAGGNGAHGNGARGDGARGDGATRPAKERV